MNRKLINIICIAMIFSCKPAVVVDKVDVNTYDILLQDSRKLLRYIYLAKDKACYEVYIRDKPSYFTAWDTLVRIDNENRKGSHYQGNSAYLDISETGYNLTYTAGEEKGKTRSFSVASKKQEQKWNEYRNQYSVGRITYAVSAILNSPHPSSSKYHIALDSDWKELIQLISKLNQKDFNAALEKFKTKYSINNIEQLNKEQ